MATNVMMEGCGTGPTWTTSNLDVSSGLEVINSCSEDTNQFGQEIGRKSFLYIIDYQPALLFANQGDSAVNLLQESLWSICQFYRRSVMLELKSTVCVVVSGVKGGTIKCDSNGNIVLIDRSLTAPAALQKLERLAEHNFMQNRVESICGNPNGGASHISSWLNIALQWAGIPSIADARALKPNSHNVIVISPVARASESDNNISTAATETLRIVEKSGINFEVIYLENKAPNRFYTLPWRNSVQTPDSLLDFLRRKAHQMPRAHDVNLVLGPGISVSAKLIACVAPKNVPAVIYEDSEELKPVYSGGVWRTECGETLLRSEDIQLVSQLNGEDVGMQPGDRSSAGYALNPLISPDGAAVSPPAKGHELLFLGSMPISDLPISATIGTPSLLQAMRTKEGRLDSSFQAFATALRATRKAVVMLSIPRQTIGAYCVAIVPTVDETSASLLMKPMPFRDDIRMLDFRCISETTSGTLDIAAKHAPKAYEFLKELEMDYFTPDAVDNPAFNRHYSALEAFALGISPSEQETDDLTLDESCFGPEAATAAAAWKRMIDGIGNTLK